MPLGDPMVENRGILSRDTIQLPIRGLGKHIFDNALQIRVFSGINCSTIIFLFSVASMSTARKHLGCAVYQDYIYAVGGRDDSTELNSVERYSDKGGFYLVPYTNCIIKWLISLENMTFV